MNQPWQNDKRWSDVFLPEIKRILGENLIAEPPIEEDTERNTDLIVLRLDAVRVGCRVRRAKYQEQYGHEFTIRAGRPSGVKTELAKIIEGWGDYFFYGFADEASSRLTRWLLGDLKVFRLWFNQQLFQCHGKCPGRSMANGDGSSSFRVFRRDELPDEFIVSSG